MFEILEILCDNKLKVFMVEKSQNYKSKSYLLADYK